MAAIQFVLDLAGPECRARDGAGLIARPINHAREKFVELLERARIPLRGLTENKFHALRRACLLTALLAALLALASVAFAAEPVHHVTIHWHPGPTLTRQAEPVVDSWWIVGPIGKQSLATFLERQVDGKKLAWNIAGQVNQLAHQLRTRIPQGDFIGQWIPSEGDWLTITESRLEADFIFRSGKERHPIRLVIERFSAARFEPDIVPIQ